MRLWILGVWIVVLLMIGAFVDHVESDYESQHPIAEIKWIDRRAMTAEEMLIAKCPLIFGQLDKWLNCRERVIKRYRKDI